MMAFESFLKSIKEAHALNKPFVIYREPNQKLVKSLIQTDDNIYRTNAYTEEGFVFAPFDENDTSILIPLANATYLESSYDKESDRVNDFFEESSLSIAKKEHLELVTKGIEHIKKSTLKKVVLSRKEELIVSDFSPIDVYIKLLSIYQNAYVYLWYHPKIGLWLGATPEKLIMMQKKQFTTVSLAGTQPFRKTENVEWGSKELEEQKIVTEYITSRLAKIVEGMNFGEVQTVRAGNLLHLSTQITGTLRDKNDLHLMLNTLHPTPAICGVPMLDAKKFILENEQYNREFYTGFLGEININDRSNLFVNLRCMKVEDTKLSLFLGGGITHDSHPESEWLETIEKSKVMKRVL